MHARSAVTLTESLAVVAGAACLVGVLLPALLGARDVSDQVCCRAQLARLGEALAVYACNFDGLLPDCGAASRLGGAVPDDGRHFVSRFDACGTGAWPNVRAVGNQANLWILVREGYADPQLFICPATADRPSLNSPVNRAAMGFLAMDPGTGLPTAEESRFLGRVAAGRCSYSYQNQFAHPETDSAVTPPENATTHRLRHPPDLAILADRNPYTRAELARQPVLSPDLEPEANSLNHHGTGQNVLYLGGHVEWHETPRCGPVRPDGRRDNIYWPDEGRPDDPTNIPRSLRDAFLVP